MRIISNFRDFYDITLSVGADSEVIYHRMPAISTINVAGVARKLTPLLIPRGEWMHPGHHYARYEGSKFRVEWTSAYLLIAGKMREVMVWYASWGNPGMQGADYCGVPSLEETRAYTKQVWFGSQMGQFDREERSNLDMQISRSSGQHKASLADLAAAKKAMLAADHTDLQMKIDAPVALILPQHISAISRSNSADWEFFRNSPSAYRTGGPEETKLTVIKNMNLSRLRLHRIMDPYVLFQEIQSFISGVLPGAVSPMVKISDQAMVAKKGFDPVYGFRKRPQH